MGHSSPVCRWVRRAIVFNEGDLISLCVVRGKLNIRCGREAGRGCGGNCVYIHMVLSCCCGGEKERFFFVLLIYGVVDSANGVLHVGKISVCDFFIM